jgi:long-chain acyl-CoA synthetase
MQNTSELERYHYFLERFSCEGRLLFTGHLLAQSAITHPDHTALQMPDHSISYANLFSHTLFISTILEKHNITIRSRVLLLIENSSFFYKGYYGAWQMGAIVIPLNVFLSNHEIAHIINDAQPDIIIVSTLLKTKLDGIEITQNILHEQDIAGALTFLEQKNFSAHYLNELKKSTLKALGANEPAVILYTSGTTGFPKGVMLSSDAIMSNICQILARFSFVAYEKILCPLPLFHSFTQSTCVWGAIAVGLTIILIPKITRSALINGIQHRPTIVLGIPGLYGILCKLPHISFPDVRYFCSGGEPLTTNIRRFFALRFGRTLANGYGLTESGPVISIDLEDYYKPTHATGNPLVTIACDIRNQDTNGIGTLWITGPNIMIGYLNAPEATRSILQNGWLNTGDLAYMRPDGTLVISGREKDLIIQKGIKIYPQEIETTLCAHHQVVLAAVVGIPSDHDGELPVAYVQLVDNSTTTSKELLEHCQERLASYKIPRHIYIKDRLPMTATGKVDKKQLTKNN